MMNNTTEEDEISGHIQSLSPPSYSTHVPIIPVQQISTTFNQQTSSIPLNAAQNQLQNQQPSQSYQVPIANFYQPVISYSDIRRHYLKENFPQCFVIFHSIFMILISLIVIGIQTVLTYKEAYLSEYGAGFLAGGAIFITSLVTIITVSYRSFCLVVTSAFLHLVCLLASFGCQIVISVLAIIKSGCLDNIKKCQSDVIFISNVSMISVGIIGMVACLIYFIAIQCGVISKATVTSNQIRSGIINPNFIM